jgi:hypothetical protein
LQAAHLRFAVAPLKLCFIHQMLLTSEAPKALQASECSELLAKSAQDGIKLRPRSTLTNQLKVVPDQVLEYLSGMRHKSSICCGSAMVSLRLMTMTTSNEPKLKLRDMVPPLGRQLLRM